MSAARKSRSGRMRAPMVLAAVAVVAGLAAAEPPEEAAPAGETAAGDGASSTETIAAPRAGGAAEAGVRVYLDPETGELLDRPPAGALVREPLGDPVQPGHWLNTYSGDLLEEALPDGGFMVDLRGRFQSAVVATVDPETGEATIDCVTGPPETTPESTDEE